MVCLTMLKYLYVSSYAGQIFTYDIKSLTMNSVLSGVKGETNGFMANDNYVYNYYPGDGISVSFLIIIIMTIITK